MRDFPDEDALLDAALDLPPAKRGEFLDTTCGRDTPLRVRLDRLLAELDDASPFLDAGGALAGTFGAELIADLAAGPIAADALPPGSMVGPYRITGELGRGGMAVVYRAERADGTFAQAVALKVIKRGADTDELLSRFRQERQILASLAHPNIARVFDGGTTPDGRPFFVMELIDGERVDRYCNARQLGLQPRLALFLQVGRAVQHAHQHFVVHRDLKPSNILITDAGEIKLLDFGIAKLVGEAAADEAGPATATVHRVLTPQYASPEQIRGGPITMASDVYQLGLLLYELLAGRAAQPLEGLLPAEAERTIAETTPLKPSAAAAADPARRTWARDLRGDLDTVVLTALQKDPAVRYASVDRLLDDLERIQSGRPIQARPVSLSLRAGKFVRRHRMATATAAVVLITIGVLIAVFSVRLARERDVARREAATANQVALFVGQLFEGSNPFGPGAPAPSARDLLDRGATRIEAELAGQPEVQARLMTVVGDSYRMLGAYEPAIALHEKALAIRRAHPGMPPQVLAESLHGLGAVLYLAGRLAEARPLVEEGLGLREAVYRGDHADIATSLDVLGMIARRSSQLDAARGYAERAVAMRERVFGADHERVAMARNNLGLVYQALGDYRAAAAQYSSAAEIHERRHGPAHALVGSTLLNVAEVTRLAGDAAAARPIIERGLAILEQSLGPRHPDTGTAHNSLGSLLYGMTEYDEARRAYTRAQEIYEAALGPTHPTVAYPIENIGNILKDLDRYDEALAHYDRALAIRMKAFGPNHSLVGQTLFNQSLVRRLQRDWARAEVLLRRALRTYEAALPAGHPQIGSVGFYLGDTLRMTGAVADAETTLLKAYDILRDRRGPGHRHTRGTVAALIALYGTLGRTEDAERFRTIEQETQGK